MPYPPATTMSLPVRMMSASVGWLKCDSGSFSYTAKMVPVDTLQSMLDEPGSSAADHEQGRHRVRGGGDALGETGRGWSLHMRL